MIQKSVQSRKLCVQVIFSLFLLLPLQIGNKHNQLDMQTRLNTVLFLKKLKKIRGPDIQDLGDGFEGLPTQGQPMLHGEILSQKKIAITAVSENSSLQEIPSGHEPMNAGN